jgi:hypothetical protein
MKLSIHPQSVLHPRSVLQPEGGSLVSRAEFVASKVKFKCVNAYPGILEEVR